MGRSGLSEMAWGQLQWRSQKFVKGAGVRVRTVGRAAAAGHPMARSAVGLNGGGRGVRGVGGFWWGSPSSSVKGVWGNTPETVCPPPQVRYCPAIPRGMSVARSLPSPPTPSVE
jgi:hypothetical protein